MKLEKIADISTGLVLSRKKSSNNEGFVYELLTLKSFNENVYIEDEYLDNFISEEKIKSQYLTQEGDIIVRLSSPNTAIYITKEYENMVIPSLFAIIRNKVDTINSQFIKEIKIPEYTVEKQEKIIELNQIVIQEKILLNQLLDEKNKYHKTIMSKVFK